MLEDSGLDSLQASTVGDVGTAVAGRWGEDAAAPVRALGALVNDAAFEPDPPAATVADEAWRLEGLARAAVVAARKAHPSGLPPATAPAAAVPDVPAAAPSRG